MLEQNSVRLREGIRLLDAVPVADVVTYRISNGRDRWRGARRGAVVGALLGIAFVAYAVREDMTSDAIMVSGTAVAVPAAVMFTGVSAGIGAKIAAPDRWSAPAPLRLGVVSPAPGRVVRLGVTVRF